jgi:hypothetical protein
MIGVDTRLELAPQTGPVVFDRRAGRELPEEISRPRALDGDERQVVDDAFERRVEPVRHEGELILHVEAVRHDPGMVGSEAVDRAVVDEPAFGIDHRPVANATVGQAQDVVRQEAIRGDERVPSAHVPFDQGRHVPRAHVLANGVVFDVPVTERRRPEPAVPILESAAHPLLRGVDRTPDRRLRHGGSFHASPVVRPARPGQRSGWAS